MIKIKKSRVFTRARGGGRCTIFRLLGILPKITDETNVERCILFTGVWLTLNQKNQQKSGVFTEARDCGWRTIFILLGILLKIIDGTNGGRCIHFKGFYLTLNQKKRDKFEFSPRLRWWSEDYFLPGYSLGYQRWFWGHCILIFSLYSLITQLLAC